jgi:hypothetical protein
MPATAEVRDAFAAIHHRVFWGDPAANERLRVEVLGERTVGGTTTMLLITPWTINGLIFSAELPAVLVLAGARRPVHVLELPGLGRFGSVNLVPDVSALPDQAAARSLAAPWLKPFRLAATAMASAGST